MCQNRQGCCSIAAGFCLPCSGKWRSCFVSYGFNLKKAFYLKGLARPSLLFFQEMACWQWITQSVLFGARRFPVLITKYLLFQHWLTLKDFKIHLSHFTFLLRKRPLGWGALEEASLQGRTLHTLCLIRSGRKLHFSFSSWGVLRNLISIFWKENLDSYHLKRDKGMQ